MKVIGADRGDKHPGRPRPDPGKCPVCGADHVGCVPEGYVPPEDLVVTPPKPTSPLEARRIAAMNDDPDFEPWTVDGDATYVRVKHDVYVEETHPNTTRPVTILLYPRGYIVTRAEAEARRVTYAWDKRLPHSTEVK